MAHPAAGALQAWRALRTERAPYPAAQLAALAQRAGPQDITYSAAMHCNSPVHITVAHFIDVAAAEHLSLSLGAQVAAHMAPALRTLHPLTDVQLTTSDVMYSPEQSKTHAQSGNTAAKAGPLSVADMHALGWELHSQLPLLGHHAATVLMWTPPRDWPLLDLQQGKGPATWQLSDSVLLVVMPAQGGTDAASPESLAGTLLPWILRGVSVVDAHGAATPLDSAPALVEACLQSAAHAAARFLRVLDAVPAAGLPASTASEAAAVVQAHSAAAVAVEGGQWVDALTHSRRAWAAAQALAAHPDHAAHAGLPAEHILAVLLPIGLPIGLVIVQAVAREVRAAKGQPKFKTA